MPVDLGFKTAYVILGVPEDASDDDIRRARRRRAFAFHPDRHGKLSEAARTIREEKFKQSEAAYSKLQGANRKQYDEFLREVRANRAAPPPRPPPSPQPDVGNRSSVSNAAAPRRGSGSETAGQRRRGKGRQSLSWVSLVGLFILCLWGFSLVPSSPGRKTTNLQETVVPTDRAKQTEAGPAQVAVRSPRWFERRSGAPPDEIDRAAKIYNIPAELIRAVIAVGSEGDTSAVSNRGAIGLMQLMPETAAKMYVEDPIDPAQNIMGGDAVSPAARERVRRRHGAGPGGLQRRP